jgi:2-keto-4-pentenoate hydratase/2-oxohepta-3-ene-1,7-dioic acid hydratase in catechol pathway
VTKFVRYLSAAGASYGILDGDSISEIRGGLFGSRVPTGTVLKLSETTLLHPCEPGKIFAVGLNYGSHLGTRPRPEHPEIFYKPVTALQNPGGPIVIPRDATDLHYEGEMVVMIGKPAKGLGRDAAREAIFGVACGDDVSERAWQQSDMQWWRAKGCDTFAPVGPAIVTGLDYGNLLLQTRLNGEVVQKQYTADLIFDCPTIVSWISQWVTLMPGDLIYTGTPGSTRKLSPGDVVEVEIEGSGVLRNPVTAG